MAGHAPLIGHSVRGVTMRTMLWGLAMLAMLGPTAMAQPQKSAPEKIIIDLDIGDDIDDAFGLALALKSPEFDILGVSASFGDTATRARMLDRFLGEAGRGDIPVAAGKPSALNLSNFRQRRWAEGGKPARAAYPDAADFVLGQIRKHPGQVTLVVFGPLTNIGPMIDKDAATFRQLKRVVIMGGAIDTLTDPYGAAAPIPAHPEWNIRNDVASARKLLAAGVPLVMLPLDSTSNLKLHEVAREALFDQHGSVLTDMLMVLYTQWSYRPQEAAFTSVRKPTPTLYDAMTLAVLLEPSLCPLTPMRIEVDDNGLTRSVPGAPNAQVCLKSDNETFLRFYLGRVGGK